MLYFQHVLQPTTLTSATAHAPMLVASSKASDHVEKKLREVGFTGRVSDLENLLEVQCMTMTMVVLEPNMEIQWYNGDIVGI